MRRPDTYIEITARNLAPVLLTCFLLLWTAAVGRFAHYDVKWVLYPALLVFPVTISIHIVLVVLSQPRARFVVYAVVHVVIQSFLWAGCLMFLSKDSL
jgi:hypothetical protein